MLQYSRGECEMLPGLPTSPAKARSIRFSLESVDEEPACSRRSAVAAAEDFRACRLQEGAIEVAGEAGSVDAQEQHLAQFGHQSNGPMLLAKAPRPGLTADEGSTTGNDSHTSSPFWIVGQSPQPLPNVRIGNAIASAAQALRNGPASSATSSPDYLPSDNYQQEHIMGRLEDWPQSPMDAPDLAGSPLMLSEESNVRTPAPMMLSSSLVSMSESVTSEQGQLFENLMMLEQGRERSGSGHCRRGSRASSLDPKEGKVRGGVALNARVRAGRVAHDDSKAGALGGLPRTLSLPPTPMNGLEQLGMRMLGRSLTCLRSTNMSSASAESLEALSEKSPSMGKVYKVRLSQQGSYGGLEEGLRMMGSWCSMVSLPLSGYEGLDMVACSLEPQLSLLDYAESAVAQKAEHPGCS